MSTRPCKYFTAEERLASRRKTQAKYNRKPWTCTACDITINLGNRVRHQRYKWHLDRVAIMNATKEVVESNESNTSNEPNEL
jgi:hypothetical protein